MPDNRLRWIDVGKRNAFTPFNDLDVLLEEDEEIVSVETCESESYTWARVWIVRSRPEGGDRG